MDHLPALTGSLGDADPEVRIGAVRALRRIHSEETIALLRRGLRDEDPVVRIMSAGGLGELGPEAESSIPELEEALKDPVWSVRRVAREALQAIRRDR